MSKSEQTTSAYSISNPITYIPDPYHTIPVGCNNGSGEQNYIDYNFPIDDSDNLYNLFNRIRITFDCTYDIDISWNFNGAPLGTVSGSCDITWNVVVNVPGGVSLGYVIGTIPGIATWTVTGSGEYGPSGTYSIAASGSGSFYYDSNDTPDDIPGWNSFRFISAPHTNPLVSIGLSTYSSVSPCVIPAFYDVTNECVSSDLFTVTSAELTADYYVSDFAYMFSSDIKKGMALTVALTSGNGTNIYCLGGISAYEGHGTDSTFPWVMCQQLSDVSFLNNPYIFNDYAGIGVGFSHSGNALGYCKVYNLTTIQNTFMTCQTAFVPSSNNNWTSQPIPIWTSNVYGIDYNGLTLGSSVFIRGKDGILYNHQIGETTSTTNDISIILPNTNSYQNESATTDRNGIVGWNVPKLTNVNLAANNSYNKTDKKNVAVYYKNDLYFQSGGLFIPGNCPLNFNSTGLFVPDTNPLDGINLSEVNQWYWQAKNNNGVILQLSLAYRTYLSPAIPTNSSMICTGSSLSGTTINIPTSPDSQPWDDVYIQNSITDCAARLQQTDISNNSDSNDVWFPSGTTVNIVFPAIPSDAILSTYPYTTILIKYILKGDNGFTYKFVNNNDINPPLGTKDYGNVECIRGVGAILVTPDMIASGGSSYIPSSSSEWNIQLQLTGIFDGMQIVDAYAYVNGAIQCTPYPEPIFMRGSDLLELYGPSSVSTVDGILSDINSSIGSSMNLDGVVTINNVPSVTTSRYIEIGDLLLNSWQPLQYMYNYSLNGVNPVTPYSSGYLNYGFFTGLNTERRGWTKGLYFYLGRAYTTPQFTTQVSFDGGLTWKYNPIPIAQLATLQGMLGLSYYGLVQNPVNIVADGPMFYIMWWQDNNIMHISTRDLGATWK